MAVYIYKVFMAYHDDKDKVKNFIENHDGGSWYFIHQKENFSAYNFPNADLTKYSDDAFEFSYDEEEEANATTLIQVRDSEIPNYMIDFAETYLHNADFFELKVIYPFRGYHAMDTYSMGNYEEGYYESAFNDSSWTTEGGALDDYFDGDVKIADLLSKAETS